MKKVIPKLLGIYLNVMAIVSPRLAARQGFKLWCHPFRAPLRSHHKDFLNSSDKFELDYDGLKIQGYKWGAGSRNVLFVHGWQSHSFRWKKYIDALSHQDVTIYAIDAPGHGFTAGNFLHVPLYSDVLKKLILSVGRFHTVVTHSMGGFAILHTLYTNRDILIDKLVLMAPPRIAKDFITILIDTLKLTPRATRVIVEHFEKEIHQPIEFFSTARFAHSLSIPGLIIHDKEDMETPYEGALFIKEAWRESQLITTTGLNHNLKSPEVIQTVCDFVIQDQSVVHLSI